jgi:hypothetical protein
MLVVKRTTGFKLYFSTLCPSGRPKWDMRTMEAAPVRPKVVKCNLYAEMDYDIPCSMAYLMVGRAATIRCIYRQRLLGLQTPSTHSRVRDLVGLLVHGNVKVDTHQDLFALELEVGDGEF